jgi:hypothetical protein
MVAVALDFSLSKFFSSSFKVLTPSSFKLATLARDDFSCVTASFLSTSVPATEYKGPRKALSDRGRDIVVKCELLKTARTETASGVRVSICDYEEAGKRPLSDFLY